MCIFAMFVSFKKFVIGSFSFSLELIITPNYFALITFYYFSYRQSPKFGELQALQNLNDDHFKICDCLGNHACQIKSLPGGLSHLVQ